MDEFSRGELTFDVRDEGPADGACVVLLHGFPQDASAWSEVTPLLVGAGLRVLAFDLRGYSPRARPAGRRAYRVEVIAGDVLALLDAAGVPAAHVVGHDWGGALAWELAIRHPGRVRSLTVLSTPHWAALRWALRRSTQGLRSWYMLAMQVPVVPEAVLRAGIARGGLARLGLDAGHTRAYAERLLEPGALSGAIAWYRALATWPRTEARAPAGVVTVPTTYVWGHRDAYLGRAAATRTGVYCRGEYRFVELDADHWLPEKHPHAVAEAILHRVGGTGDLRP